MKKPNFDSLYEIAENQAGHFTTSQAKQVGYSWERLSNLTKAKKFKRIEKGLYRLNNFPVYPNEDLFTAILKSGPKSVISHETALAVYELSDLLPNIINIIIPKNRSRRRKNIKYHIQKINDDEITKYQGLPITTVERTIIDTLKNGGDIHQVQKAISSAIERGLTTKEKLIAKAQNSSSKTKSYFNQIIEWKNG